MTLRKLGSSNRNEMARSSPLLLDEVHDLQTIVGAQDSYPANATRLMRSTTSS